MEEQIPNTPEALPGNAVARVTPAGDVEEIIDTTGEWVVVYAGQPTDYIVYKTYGEARHTYDLIHDCEKVLGLIYAQAQ